MTAINRVQLLNLSDKLPSVTAMERTLVCRRCDRVWDDGDYGSRCPDCGA